MVTKWITRLRIQKEAFFSFQHLVFPNISIFNSGRVAGSLYRLSKLGTSKYLSPRLLYQPRLRYKVRFSDIFSFSMNNITSKFYKVGFLKPSNALNHRFVWTRWFEFSKSFPVRRLRTHIVCTGDISEPRLGHENLFFLHKYYMRRFETINIFSPSLLAAALNHKLVFHPV